MSSNLNRHFFKFLESLCKNRVVMGWIMDDIKKGPLKQGPFWNFGYLRAK